MKQKHTHQQQSRKSGGSEEIPSATSPPVRPSDVEHQDISNRRAGEEHPFPDGDEPESKRPSESVEDVPKQMGGARGRI
jgi:hypothetical protein